MRKSTKNRTWFPEKPTKIEFTFDRALMQLSQYGSIDKLKKEQRKVTINRIAAMLAWDPRYAFSQFESVGININKPIHEEIIEQMYFCRFGLAMNALKYFYKEKSVPTSNDEEALEKMISSDYISFKEVMRIINSKKISSFIEAVECASIEMNNYKVIKKFAEGGWSNIYLIIDEGETDEDFIKVMKVPANNLLNDNVEKIVSKHEGQLSKALEEIAKEEKRINSKSSNTSQDRFKNFQYRPIPQFFEMQKITCDGETIPALIYEYIRGSTFEKFFQEKKTIKEITEVFIGGAYALNYIHTKGFTHNDLKGDNMIVGDNGRVYVLDLAFSRLDDSESTIMGVRSYTAPERILGGSPPTEKADQYSWGVMMYEAICGEKPLSYTITLGDKQQFARVVNKGSLKPDFKELRKKAPRKLTTIVEKCMAYNPEDRYDSMQQVEDKLISLRNKL
ncbi:MAG: protein kinase [Nanoarchaeota archaeon]|nr:protein kinase [Nanoarchaeota archaeon]MBU1976653.1 protein kinase [Nanoarchaeota archaeon]